MPFLAPGDLDRAGVDSDAVTLTNPLVADESVLRTSLLPGLVKVLAFNANHRRRGLALFELGHVFGRPPVGQLLPDEREMAAVALGGADASAAVAVLREVAASWALELRVVNDSVPGLHPTRSARVEIDGAVVGAVGEIDPRTLESFGVVERVAWLELDLDALLAVPHGERTYRRVALTPTNDIDLAFSVPDDVAADQIERTVRAEVGEYLADLSLFDVFRGPGVPDGRRSLAFALSLQAPDRTLTDLDVAEIRDRCISAVAVFGAELRG
jgi:phenylalanyl-tRNA synthetase beta chain